mmetsp:Transcript_1410/g.2501  ORF Transcript_1410/g.2501 Transcript_1410/m.2501 type:complete len:218 (-) Transcript_1410:830-1483(-)
MSFPAIRLCGLTSWKSSRPRSLKTSRLGPSQLCPPRREHGCTAYRCRRPRPGSAKHPTRGCPSSPQLRRWTSLCRRGRVRWVFPPGRKSSVQCRTVSWAHCGRSAGIQVASVSPPPLPARCQRWAMSAPQTGCPSSTSWMTYPCMKRRGPRSMASRRRGRCTGVCLRMRQLSARPAKPDPGLLRRHTWQKMASPVSSPTCSRRQRGRSPPPWPSRGG